MNYDAWYDLYNATYKRSLSDKTRESYSYIHGQIISPIIGYIDLADLTPEHLQGVLNLAAEHGSRQAQVCYALLHAVLRRAHRSRLMPWQIMDAIDKPAHHAQPGRKLSDADLSALLPEIRKDPALSLCLYAGLRRGEVIALQWGDIDLMAKTIRINKAAVRIKGKLIIKPPKSASGNRVIPILPQLRAILSAAYCLDADQRVCPLSPSSLDHRWRRLQAAAAIAQPYRLHDLRHTYGSHLATDGCNMRILQYLMGHATLAVTSQVYCHIDPSAAASELSRLYAFSR